MQENAVKRTRQGILTPTKCFEHAVPFLFTLPTEIRKKSPGAGLPQYDRTLISSPLSCPRLPFPPSSPSPRPPLPPRSGCPILSRCPLRLEERPEQDLIIIKG
jgi:hypothetical protein